METITTIAKRDSVGINGWLLIICIIEIFITLYLTPFKTGIKGVSVLNFVILILFISGAIRITFNHERICFQLFDYLLIIYLGYSFFSVLLSCYYYEYNYSEELILFKNYLNHFIIYFLLKNAIKTTKEAKILIYTLIFLLITICLHGLISYFFTDSAYIHYEGRVQGIIGEPNVFGMFLVFMSPFLLLAPTKQVKKMIIFKIMAIIILNLAIIQTGSRGTFVALIFLYLLIIFETKKKIKTSIIGLVVLSITFIIINLSLFGEKNVIDRLQNPRFQNNISGKYDWDYYSGRRLTLWNFAVNGWYKKPIFGQGVRTYRKNVRRIFGKESSAHNEYLEILYERGLLGFFLFVTFYYLMWKYLKNYNKFFITKACKYGLICYFITMIFVSTSVARYPIWIALAISLRYANLKNKELDNP